MKGEFEIEGRVIGEGSPAYVIAEISANHNGSLESALEHIDLAKECGADAVKIQTYTPDSLTLDVRKPPFLIEGDSIWEGKNFYELYEEAQTPYEWHPVLFDRAREIGITLFSSPFDEAAVELLEGLGAPAYKIASFELVHLPLIRRAAETGKPLIMSTGMASLEEIEEAVAVAREAGCEQLALLKCTSSYPAPPEESNLARISDMAERFGVVAGLSDHTMGGTVPVAAVALGARIIEKHFIKTRDDEGPDSSFSMEPQEFSDMVQAVRIAQSALGTVTYERTTKESVTSKHRRSIFASSDIAAGDSFSPDNVRVVRPGDGLHPREWEGLLGKVAAVDISRGTPISPDFIG